MNTAVHTSTSVHRCRDDIPATSAICLTTPSGGRCQEEGCGHGHGRAGSVSSDGGCDYGHVVAGPPRTPTFSTRTERLWSGLRRDLCTRHRIHLHALPRADVRTIAALGTRFCRRADVGRSTDRRYILYAPKSARVL